MDFNKVTLSFLLLIILNCFCKCQVQRSGLRVSIVARTTEMNFVAGHCGFDKGGNTSVAFDAENSFKWSGHSPYKAESWGYFNQDNQEIPYIKRDRDLGQTFTYGEKTSKKLRAITVATGYGTNVVRSNMYEKNISVQVFEVSGNPSIHNNGSDSTVEAFHGFPHNRVSDSISHIRDDYFIGEVYTSLGVFTGASFPAKKEFGFSIKDSEVPPDHPNLKGKYLRFVLPENSNIVLKPKKKYAFLIMIDSAGTDCGFTLANNYIGNYPGGHAIRRDGNGRFPPVPANPQKSFTDVANAKALSSAHFPTNFSERSSIPPGTNGYPDVDTRRDLFFIIEGR